jgi:hypothetical protein
MRSCLDSHSHLDKAKASEGRSLRGCENVFSGLVGGRRDMRLDDRGRLPHGFSSLVVGCHLDLGPLT